MTLSSLAITVASTTSTTLKKQSRNSKFSTLALFFVATSASSAARAFSSSTPTFLPRHHQQSLSRRSGASSTLNNSVIYNTRGGSLASIVGKKLSLSRRFSSTQIEQEVVSEMDEVKAAASKISAADKLALMRQKMEENGVDGAFYVLCKEIFMIFGLFCFANIHISFACSYIQCKKTQSTSFHQMIHT